MQCLICDEMMGDGLAIRFRYGVVQRNKSRTEYFMPIDFGDGSDIKWTHKSCAVQDAIRFGMLRAVFEPCPLCHKHYAVDAGPTSPGETVLEVLRGHLYESNEGDSPVFETESGGYACFDCTSQEWRGVTQRIMNLHLEAPF